MIDANVTTTLRLAQALVAYIRRINPEPDFVIGNPEAPYLRRWKIKEPTEQEPGIYVHQILRDDDDRALHDHPWDSTVCIVEGSYREIMPIWCQLREAGSVRQMQAESLHRLEVVDGPVWTVVFTGIRRREWGFQCPQGWVPWYEFVASENPGMPGKGCG